MLEWNIDNKWLYLNPEVWSWSRDLVYEDKYNGPLNNVVHKPLTIIQGSNELTNLTLLLDFRGPGVIMNGTPGPRPTCNRNRFDLTSLLARLRSKYKFVVGYIIWI